MYWFRVRELRLFIDKKRKKKPVSQPSAEQRGVADDHVHLIFNN
jgi:hypothetical protein